MRLWPLPAILTWAAAWGFFVWAQGQGLGSGYAAGMACTLGLVLAWWGGRTAWQQGWMALGFPLSLLLTQAATVGWVWLWPLLLLLLLYPLRAWRDAPWFPTPPQALDALPQHAALPAGARILDAGCGLGHGLYALRRAYPHAALHGLEWSWLLRWLCALRCPWASVRHGDIWRADWSGYALVYVFQRPESMARAAAKARAELPPGAWLVSLEFAIPGLRAQAEIALAGGKMLWLYQAPLTISTGE